MEQIKNAIQNGKTVLGIELGSTRIKAVLIDENNNPIASGSYEWENRLENGIWTYSLEDVWTGIQTSYKNMADDVKNQYGEILVPFRTWRNSITGKAAAELTSLFDFNIPERWSIAHLYQAILNGEEHISKIKYLTTLAGYVHWKLTGEFVLGIGEASGMFPIDSASKDYNKGMIEKFDKLISNKNLPYTISDLLPKVLVAGENAGTLSE